MRLLVIINLSAGLGDASIYDFMRAFSQDDDELVVRYTDGTTRAERFVDDAKSFDAVVVSGGDGTVTSVCYALRNTGVPLLPYPSGTANLMSINLDSPTEPYQLAQMVRECKTMDFDMGELEFGDTVVGFSIIAGAGYDASIMEGARRMSPSLGESAYLIAALAKPNPDISHFTVTIDDKTIEATGSAVLVVNFGKLQFDIPLTPENNPRDGMLEIGIAKTQTAAQMLPIVLACILDREGKYPSRTDAFETYRGKNISVTADPPLTIQYDGEPTGITTPFSARILPKSSTIIVDANSDKIKRFME